MKDEESLKMGEKTETKKREYKYKLAQSHWDFLENWLSIIFELLEYIYIEAFVHGYKHAEEDIEKKKWTQVEGIPYSER
ncbi:MAG: hypothetical protein DRP11_04585 [Candidatus Aenigmatarchaeota archaeon]|nr:MAG: hypothetical protein DRP11_04585 [Candidatus Aenigmarchaeota archaeon]